MANVLGNLFKDIADAIRSKNGETGTMKPAEFPEKIAAIQTGGGGGSGDVRYVTFLSHDGTVILGIKAVAVGDDCADPVDRGLFDTPTRESTAQYDYTFSGWSTVANGAASASALKAVTEDRTVYAAYTQAVRYYTISFYDGSTLLESQNLQYGTVPVITDPQKSGYSFDGWEPAIAAVTGNASYYAKWSEAITFASGTWEDIARICEAGQAEKYFSVGETRKIAVSGIATLDFEIIGINHDDLADGSGKAGLTIASTIALKKYSVCGDASQNLKNGWKESTIRTALNTTGVSKLPSDLVTHIKEVKKLTISGTSAGNVLEETTDKFFPLSATEFFGDNVGYTINGQGSQYEHYKTVDNRKALYYDNSNIVSSIVGNHDTRSRSTYIAAAVIVVNPQGSSYGQGGFSNQSILAFCI